MGVFFAPMFRLLLALVLLVAGGTALAEPVAPAAPDFALEGTSGSTRRLSDYVGRVVVLIYEDRDSSHQNDALKRAISERSKDAALTRQVSVLPIANLGAYDFWPVRSMARKAVLDIARRVGVEILLDWSGTAAAAYGFTPHLSHVLIIDAAGRIVFRASGALAEREREAFFGTLDRVVGIKG